MKHPILRTAALAATLSLASLPAASQIIVGTGADLQAAVDSAPSGSVIEIHSDSTFFGELVFGESGAKDLTLRPGAGFTPTLAGLSLQPAVTIECADRLVRLEA